MIEYLNFFLLSAIISTPLYLYYKYHNIFYVISIIMNSDVLNQLTNLEENVANESKPKRTRKKKVETLPIITEEENENVTE